MSDHVVHPASQSYPSPYLYDPLVTLAWAAARTTTIGLGTSVLVVPMHEPVALANQLASLDSLSGGRLRLAVGVGWSAAEYEALGSDFATRGRRLDEALDMFKVLWRDDPASFDGRYRTFSDIRLLPKPAGPVPIWCGGSTEAAYRRAVERADGFQLISVTPEEARPVVERLRRDRPDEGFTVSLRTGWDPLGMDPETIAAELRAYEDAGVRHVVAAPWRRDLGSWIDAMRKLASIVSAS